MMKAQNDNIQIQEKGTVDLRNLFFKFLANWHWFAVSIVICCIGMYLYLRFQVPVYRITASVLIKEEDKKRGGMNQGPLAAIQDLGMFSMSSNFDNEVEILRSRTLIKKVVEKLGLYITVRKNNCFDYAEPLYSEFPISLYMTPDEASVLTGHPIKVSLECSKEGKLNVVVDYYDKESKRYENKHATFNAFPAVLTTPAGVINFSVNHPSMVGHKPFRLAGEIFSPREMADYYAQNLEILPTSKTTTIAKIILNNTNIQRGVDFIQCLVDFYNQDANDEKNLVARKTADFIKERIAIINRDLGITESRIADFKQKSGLTDLTSDAKLALQENSKYQQLRTENTTQISLVRFLRDYIMDPANKEEVIPANVGLKDNNLSSVIEHYNAMIIERKRLLRTSRENNPAVVRLGTGIEAMQRTVLTTVNSVMQGLIITKNDLDRQALKFEARISESPLQEKEFMNIQRQQEIQATLYTMLLQKREENAITLEATANNSRIVEEPMADINPVAPKKLLLMLASLILGVAFPIGGIFLKEFLKYKIENREDVEAITDIPIIAELPLIEMSNNRFIVIQENRNDMMEECFRGFRTNLLFMLDKNERVILFSSTMSGEGKSFIAGNLAASIAFLGKKVIIVGLDIRKPRLNEIFNLSKKSEGITNYLANAESDLFALIKKSGISDNLDILPSGPVPPNPTELVSRNTLDKAISQLKEKYDYIIIDTAPIAQVTDTAIIGRVADMCVYVGRADYTPRVAFGYINALNASKKFSKLAVILNGVELKKRSHQYGYGYGYGYGYEDGEKKNKSRFTI